MACCSASTSGVATHVDFLSLGYPKPLIIRAKRKVEMEEKKRNIRIDQDGIRHAPGSHVAGVATNYGTP